MASSARVLVRLAGGLGNQLFQLSAALHLARRVQASQIFYDVGSLAGYESKREFDLIDVFKDFSGGIFFCKSESFINRWICRLRLGRILSGRCFFGFRFHSAEKHFPSSFDGSQCHVLDGYFHDPKICLSDSDAFRVRSTLEMMFSLPKFHSHQLNVGVHIRRGDYLVGSASEIYEKIPLSYYLKVVGDIKKQNPSCQFYVFSDDRSVATEFASCVQGVCVWEFGFSVLEEFLFLSNCDVIIGGNSTFSWWAGYLASHRTRVVFPFRWFKLDSLNSGNKLLIARFEYHDV